MKIELIIKDATPAQIAQIFAMAGDTSIPIGVIEQNDEGTANPNAPTVDKDGVPWIESIHAATKALNTDGTWRKKRGVSDAVYSQVTADVKAKMTGAQQTPAPIMPPPGQQQQQFTPPSLPPQQQPAPGPVPMMPPTGMQPQQPVMPMPGTVPPPGMPPQTMTTPPAPPTGPDFQTFMVTVQQQLQSGALNAEWISWLTVETGKAHGVQLSAITDIAGNPAMIGTAIELLRSQQKWPN